MTHVLNMKSCIILRFPKGWASWPVKSCQNQFISHFLCLVSLCFGIWPLDNDQFSDGCLIILFFLPLSMIMTTAGLHHWTFHSSIEPENIENDFFLSFFFATASSRSQEMTDCWVTPATSSAFVWVWKHTGAFEVEDWMSGCVFFGVCRWILLHFMSEARWPLPLKINRCLKYENKWCS